jgi:hypothetical protein
MRFAATGLLIAPFGHQLTILSLIPATFLCARFAIATSLFGVGMEWANWYQ